MEGERETKDDEKKKKEKKNVTEKRAEVAWFR